MAELGGTLWIDNTGAREVSKRFDESVRRELKAAFPDATLERISLNTSCTAHFIDLIMPQVA